ncbi:hypothetical protein PV327_000912 [Microctonus hyperodae]|uniref:Uncharacterized protein n=1 Tax=Microctonus hyperodae TaxID=165561 RepID=A0AA39L2N3_MICHY|nr:hypothetical protein PV327_000912 [Microctonus hyperodae]KAK0182816.1 hypothetical protein PV327_000912 [Microctonus hyperodae]
MDVHAMESLQKQLDILVEDKENCNPRIIKLIRFINMDRKEIERMKKAVRKPFPWDEFQIELARYLQSDHNLPASFTSDHLVAFLINMNKLRDAERRLINLQMKIIDELSRRLPNFIDDERYISLWNVTICRILFEIIAIIR